MLEEVEITSKAIEIIAAGAAESSFLLSLNLNIENYGLKSCCTLLAKDIMNINDFNIALNCTQKTNIWHEIRQLRITGNLFNPICIIIT